MHLLFTIFFAVWVVCILMLFVQHNLQCEGTIVVSASGVWCSSSSSTVAPKRPPSNAGSLCVACVSQLMQQHYSHVVLLYRNQSSRQRHVFVDVNVLWRGVCVQWRRPVLRLTMLKSGLPPLPIIPVLLLTSNDFHRAMSSRLCLYRLMNRVVLEV